MKIQSLGPLKSIGLVLAQTYNLPGKIILKGTFITNEIVAYFKMGNVQTILCAVPEEGDVHEDEAAEAISNSIDKNQIYAEKASTGRVNFKSQSLCLVRYERALIREVNLVDESIAFSIVEHNQLIAKNDLIATLKIIPFFAKKNSWIKLLKYLLKMNFSKFTV